MKADPGRWARGWLSVEIRSHRPERLLNLALSQGLELKEVRWLSPGVILIQLSPDDLRRLRPLTRQARCTLHIRRRRGLPFILATLVRRPLLPLAAVLFIPLLAWLCSIVAAVEVTSPYQLDPMEENLVYELAKEAGVEAGRCRWAMDLEAAEEYILQGFPRLFYAEILKHGNRLEISVVRRIDVAEEEQIRPPGDLVAAAAGVIVDVLVQRGTAAVSPGDTVQQGQVLISGAFAGEYLGAVGIVTAQVYGEGYAECYRQEVIPTPTGDSFQQVRLAVASGYNEGAEDAAMGNSGAEGQGAEDAKIGNADTGSEGVLLLGGGGHYLLSQRQVSRHPLLLWRKIPLPVEIVLVEVAELDPVPLIRSPEQANQIALEQARDRAWQAVCDMAGAGILTEAEYSDQLLDLGDGVSRVRSIARVIADVGLFRPLSEQDLALWQETQELQEQREMQARQEAD